MLEPGLGADAVDVTEVEQVVVAADHDVGDPVGENLGRANGTRLGIGEVEQPVVVEGEAARLGQLGFGERPVDGGLPGVADEGRGRFRSPGP